MLPAIFLFELKQRLRRISTYVYFVVFFGLGLLFALMSGGAFTQASVDFGTGGKVLLNSPYALNGIITYICFFGIVITAAIAGQATYQDIANNCAVFFYTAPISKLDYLGGRFLAAIAVQIVIFSGVGLAAWIGTLTPWIDKTRLGPQMVAAYFQPYFINVLPNLLFLSAIFFALAALTRKMLPVYVAGVLVLIAYFALAQAYYGLALSYAGRWQEGAEAARRALRLSPRDLFSGVCSSVAASAEFRGGNYHEAIRLAREAIRQRTDFAGAYRVLTASAAMAGEVELAKASLQQLRRVQPNISLAWIVSQMPPNEAERERYLEGLRRAGLE